MDIAKDLSRDFLEMARLYDKLGDTGRSFGFRKAGEALAKYNGLISSGAQAKAAVGKSIGPSSAEIIDEYIRGLQATGYGNIARLQELRQRTGETVPQLRIITPGGQGQFVLADDPARRQTLDFFKSFYGVGDAKAEKLYNMGARTLEDIWNSGLLDESTKAYIMWRDHMNLRIPREEMDIINITIGKLFAPYNVQWIMAGSYRRGEASSGDVDLVVIGRSDFRQEQVLYALSSIIVSTLAQGETLSRTIIRLGPDYNAHRLDVHMATPESYIYTLLHFTGSDQLNKLMRQRVIDLGLTLNEKGLFGQSTHTSHPASSEEDIFRWLGLRYIPPSGRTKDIQRLDMA